MKKRSYSQPEVAVSSLAGAGASVLSPCDPVCNSDLPSSVRNIRLYAFPNKMSLPKGIREQQTCRHAIRVRKRLYQAPPY